MSSSSGQSSQSHQEYRDHVQVLNRLLKSLRDSDIPGPQLFRLDKEFRQPLGDGSEGSVRGIDKDCTKAYYQKASDRALKRWPLDAVAIKRHQKAPASGRSASTSSRDDLANRFHAAEREVLTLSPDRFRGNPNIVQLKGWGLCLDTIENPQSGCCESIQMPLLVLERAYKNLYEFLQEDLFPSEETVQWHSALEPRLLEEGRTAGSRRANTLSQNPGKGLGYVEAAARWIAQATGFGPDTYELIRSLCLDIGRGLESLHRVDFTHGDLKPQNVLIFRYGTRWTAKLCDFGCTQGNNDPANPDAGVRRHPYRGTKAWHPPTREISGLLTQEELQRCDLYVYGLLVWSAFYLKGEPPKRPSQTEAANATRDLFGGEQSWGSGKRSRLAASINKVFEDTLCAPADRALRPWVNLDHEASEKDGGGENQGKSHQSHPMDSPSPSPSQGTQSLQPHLTREQKATYALRGWWRPGWDARHTLTDRDPGTTLAPQAHVDAVGPAVSGDLGVDDIHYSTDLFVDKHGDDIGPLINEMTESLRSPEATESAVNIYCCARFRSRMPLEWWQEQNRDKINFLHEALISTPAVDICTLAWLCKGPVGSAEIQALPADFLTWRAIVHPTFLNESERLDRLLLLLEFGARLDQRLGSGTSAASALIWYLRTCRQETLPFIIREIRRRWDTVKHSSHIPPATRAHLTGREDSQIGGGPFSLVRRATLLPKRGKKKDSVLEDLDLLFDSRIAALWAQYMHGDPADEEPTPPDENITEPDDTTPLLNRDATSTTARSSPPADSPLPPGWKKHYKSRRPRGNDENHYFEDESTGSITLTKPTVSFIRLRQIKVGFLGPTPGPAANLDLSQYVASRLVMSNPRALEDEAQARFPAYDNDWFAIERETQHPSEDVLAELKDIRSFAERIVTPGFKDALAEAGLRVVRGLLMLLILVLGLAFGLAVLVAIVMAAWVLVPVAMGLCLWFLIWVALLFCGLPCPGSFEDWYVVSMWVAVPLAAVALYFLLQEPCPDGPVGVLPGGETCHRCWWIIWSWYRCRVEEKGL